MAAFVFFLFLIPYVLGEDIENGPQNGKSFGQSGSGLGDISQAPRWLQEEESSLYFPLKHKTTFMEAHSKSHPAAWKEFTRQNERVLVDANSSFISWDIGGDSETSYYTTIALGSNNQVFNVLIDTGVGLSWVQCECINCATSTHYSAAPLHTPFQLTQTSQSEACNGTVCQTLMQEASNDYSCGNTTGNQYCQYNQQYLDGGGSSGAIITDSITVETGNGAIVQPPIEFGCGMSQSGSLLNGTVAFDGVLGLAPSNYSIVNRLSAMAIIRNSFSVCLDGNGIEGHLILGRLHMAPAAVFTPALANNGNYWKANLLSIIVDDKYDIAVGSGSVGLPVIFDTGSGGTLLPYVLYKTLFSIVFPDLANTSLQAFPYSPCLQFKGNLTGKDLAQFYSPIKLKFQDYLNASKTVTLGIPVFNFMDSFGTTNGYTQFCINGYGVNSTNPSLPGAVTPIIGAPWLRNFDFLFDGEKGVIGWYPVECKTGDYMDSFGVTSGQEFKYPTATSPPSTTFTQSVLSNVVTDPFSNIPAAVGHSPPPPMETVATGPIEAPAPSESISPPVSVAASSPKTSVTPITTVYSPPPVAKFVDSPPPSLAFAASSPPPPPGKSGAKALKGSLVFSVFAMAFVMLV